MNGNVPNDESSRDPLQDDAVRQETVHQEADKVYKAVYSDADVVEWALRKRINAEWLRQARTPAEFMEMIEKLGELPPDSPKRKALTKWMQVSIIAGGAKEEDVANLKTLEDMANPFVQHWAAIRRDMRQELIRELRDEVRREDRLAQIGVAIIEMRHRRRTAGPGDPSLRAL